MGICGSYTASSAGGKMAVIQNPNPHIPLAGFVQNDVHVPPLSIAAKIGMQTAFNANSPDVICIYLS